jgi:hypothetical protein
MDLIEILSYVTNNGLAIVLIVYYLKNNNKTNQEMTEVVKDLKNSNDRLSQNITTLLDSCLIKKEE